MSSNHGRDAAVSISPGADRSDERSIAGVGCTALPCQHPHRSYLAHLGRDVDPVGPALLGGPSLHNRVAPGEHDGVDIVERHRVGVEDSPQARGQLAQGAEGARHDQHAPARAHDLIESTQHARCAEVVGVDERPHELGRRCSGGKPCRSIGEDDVDAEVARADRIGERCN